MTLLTVEDNAEKLAKPAKRVDNPQSTETILGIQALKRIAFEWEQEHGSRCEGLAATQIGWNRRVAILRSSDEVAPRDPRRVKNVAELLTEEQYAHALAFFKKWMKMRGGSYDPWHVLINPQIVNSQGEQESVEGCLSVPGSSYKVKRPKEVVFKFQLPNTKRTKHLVVKGRDATVLMHEVDHLDGVLIRDHAIEAYVGR